MISDKVVTMETCRDKSRPRFLDLQSPKNVVSSIQSKQPGYRYDAAQQELTCSQSYLKFGQGGGQVSRSQGAHRNEQVLFLRVTLESLKPAFSIPL